MFTLIIREIRDNWIFFILAAFLAFAFSLAIGWQMYSAKVDDAAAIMVELVINAVCGIFVFCGLGAAQMYWDRMKKISALLATLAVTRNQIFASRVTAGILAVVIGFLPAVITITVVSNMVEPSSTAGLKLAGAISAGIWIPLFLFCIASYCIGLQAGWTANKIIPTLGALLMSLILVEVIWIKGFGPGAYLIIIAIIICCLYRAWQIFVTAAL
jgi:hypothetical protein